MKRFVNEAGGESLHTSIDGACPMLNYRAYVLDDDGRFEDVRLIKATADLEACAEARRLGFMGRIELWCRDRLITCGEFVRVRRLAQGDPLHSEPVRRSDDPSAH
jgi:hypothetical protein